MNSLIRSLGWDMWDSIDDRRWYSRPASILLGCVLLAAGSYRAAAQEAAIPVVIDNEPIVLNVEAAAGDAAVSTSRSVRLSPDLTRVFEDDPVIWAPDASQESLRSVIDVSSDLPLVRLGLESDPAAQVAIAFDRGHLTTGQERKLTLTLRRPRELAAGVYRGQIVAQWQSLRIGKSVKYVWPVYLNVSGRQLLDVRFSKLAADANPAALRAGDLLSVTTRVLTVNCELGQGGMTLGWRRPGDDARAPTILFSMPLDSRPPLDPALDLPKAITPLCPNPTCPPEWLDDVLSTEMTVSEPAIPLNRVEVKIHEVTAQLPSCARLGDWQANVTWEGLPSRPTLERSTPHVSVTSGIRVHPRFPIAAMDASRTRLEGTVVQVLSTEELGESVPLIVKFGQESRALVALRSEADVAAASRGEFEYRVESGLDGFNPDVVGDYEILVSNDATPAAKEALKAGRTVEVVFNGATSLDQDVILFVEGPPIHWQFFHSAREGWGRHVVREQAVQIRGTQNRAEKLQGELRAIGKERGENSELREWHVARDAVNDLPQVSFPNDDVAKRFPDIKDEEGTQGRLGIYDSAAASAAPNATAPLAAWPEAQCPNNTVSFNLGVQLDPATPGTQEPLGQRRFLLRILVSGIDRNGKPLHRIHNEMIVVDVQSAWEQYHKKWLIIGAITLGSLALLWVAYRVFRRLMAIQPGATVRLSTEAADVNDYSNEFLDGGQAVTPTAGAAGGPMADEPTPPSGLPGSSPQEASPMVQSPDSLGDNEYAKQQDWMT